jgi:hypothetical protein
MSMFSELAVESEVQDYCREVERLLQEGADNGMSPDAVRALKKIGRFALTRFEWDTPEWAAKYDKMFED